MKLRKPRKGEKLPRKTGGGHPSQYDDILPHLPVGEWRVVELSSPEEAQRVRRGICQVLWLRKQGTNNRLTFPLTTRVDGCKVWLKRLPEEA